MLARFARDGEIEVSSVLHDLTESGLVFCSGSGRNAVYRAASDEELGQFSRVGGENGLDEMAWVLIYRQGATTLEQLCGLLRCEPSQAEALIARLVAAKRVQESARGYVATEFVIELGSTVGWEAAVFDHLQAIVQTICQRLGSNTLDAADAQTVGGSTYSFDLWPGHPLEAEVKGRLAAIRAECRALRKRVEAINAASPQAPRQQVVVYAGQCLLERDADGSGEGDGRRPLSQPRHAGAAEFSSWLAVMDRDVCGDYDGAGCLPLPTYDCGELEPICVQGRCQHRSR